MAPMLPLTEVCQVATILLQSIRSLGASARNHQEAIPKIFLLESTVQQLKDVQARERNRLQMKKHHVEQANALESLENLCEQLEQQVKKAKKIVHKKGFQLKLHNIHGALLGVSRLGKISTTMESLINSWLKLQNLPIEVRNALQNNLGAFSPYLEVQSDPGYMPLAVAEDVFDLLQNSENRVLLVHGMSGIGKSSLARFVATNPPERFNDGALELCFGQACSIAGASNDVLKYCNILTAKLCILLRKLGCKEEQPEGVSLDHACQLLQEVLTGKSYLIVLDDVWEVDITTRFTRLSGNNCKFLITTRMESVHSIGEADKVEILERDVKEVGKAILMYHTQMSKLPVSEELWEELLHRCGYHPLTISVIGNALSGETRREEWEKAIHNLSTYAAKATVPVTYAAESASTIFGTFQFSLRALSKDAQDLFTSFALLRWSEPIPEVCLEKLWAALNPDSIFRLEVGRLVKGSLIGKPDSKFCYRMHDMASMYLDNCKFSEALQMLRVSEFLGSEAAVTWAEAAAWMYRYGKPETKTVALDYLTLALRSGISVLQVTVLNTVVELLDFNSTLTGMPITSDLSISSERFEAISEVEIIHLVSSANVHPDTVTAIVQYIGNVYAPNDYKSHANDLINAGAVDMLSSVYMGCDSSSVTAIMYEALSVLYELVKIADARSVDALLQDAPVRELVELYTVGLAMDILERLCELGGEAVVEEIFAAGLWEKLANDCKNDQLGLLWPRRERSIIKDRFMGMQSDRSRSWNGEEEEWSVSRSIEQESLLELHQVLRKASECLSQTNCGDSENIICDDVERTPLEKEASVLEALSVVRAALRGKRGAPARAWEVIIRSTNIAQTVMQRISPYAPSGIRQLATDCLWEINYHPSSTAVLEELLTGEALENLMCTVVSPYVEDEVSCKLFEVLESLLNDSRRQDEIVEKGGMGMLFKLIMSHQESRPKLQEKALFYIVLSPLHVKRETGAWIECLLEEGVVEALALFPNINRHNTNLPVLPFWFLSKFGTSITKSHRLQTMEQSKLQALFTGKTKAALPQLCAGVPGADISSIEFLLKL